MSMDKMIPLMLDGIKDTLYMTTVSTLFAYLLGLPIAILLVLTAPSGLKPQKLVFFRQSAQQKIAQQGQRQKRQHENVGIEQHVGMCSFSKNQNGQSPASTICAANARMTSLFASSCAASVTRESPAAISSAIASLISGP